MRMALLASYCLVDGSLFLSATNFRVSRLPDGQLTIISTLRFRQN